MTNRRFWSLVGAAAVVGLIVRIVWVVWVAREPASLYDPARYLGYARAISSGKGYIEPLSGHPTSYYPPGYPWFLGIVAWLAKPFTHDIPLAGGIAQAVLGAATAVLGGQVARRLAGAWAGVAAAVALALYPNLIFHTGALLGETLYDFLFLAFLAIVLGARWSDGISPWRALASGVVLGLAVMVRPISLAIVPVVVLAWWWHQRTVVRDRGGERAFVPDSPDLTVTDDAEVPAAARVEHGTRPLRLGLLSLLLVAGVVACIVPWTVRNEIRMHHFVLISTNTGDNFCIGHAEGATGAFGLRKDCLVRYNLLDGPDSEVKADSAKLHAGIDGMKANLGHEPWMTWNRFYVTWIRDGDHDAVNAVQAYRTDRWIAIPTEARLYRVADVAYWFVALVGVAGLVNLVRRRRPEDLLLFGSAVMTAVVPLAFFGDSRFKVPVIPLLIIAAATLLTRFDDRGAARAGGAA